LHDWFIRVFQSYKQAVILGICLTVLWCCMLSNVDKMLWQECIIEVRDLSSCCVCKGCIIESWTLSIFIIIVFLPIKTSKSTKIQYYCKEMHSNSHCTTVCDRNQSDGSMNKTHFSKWFYMMDNGQTVSSMVKAVLSMKRNIAKEI